MADQLKNQDQKVQDDFLNHDPIKAAKRDSDSPVWDMSQERMFIENLLSQRFNYFLLFFSLTVGGFANAKNPIYAEIILILGAIITTLFAMVLRRSQQKLDIILENLFSDDSHPAKIIDDLAKGSGKSRRKYIGICIPTICSITIIAAAIIHLCWLLFPFILNCHHCNCMMNCNT